MRRTLLLLAGAVVLALPAAAAARPHSRPAAGFLVVHSASADGGVAGRPVATLSVRGFVLGRITQEGAVEMYHLLGTTPPQAAGVSFSRHRVKWRGQPGVRFSGSDFRFRGVGGVWRVVVYGAGVSLYAGGVGKVALHGQVANPRGDGSFSIDGAPFASMPSGVVIERFGAK